jgi:hypothetical protein
VGGGVGGAPAKIGGGGLNHPHIVGNGIACSGGGAGFGAVTKFGGGVFDVACAAGGAGSGAVAKVTCFAADFGFGGGAGLGLGGGAGGGAAFSGGDPPMAGAWCLEGVGGEAPDGVGGVGFGGGAFAAGGAGSDPGGTDGGNGMANEKVHLLPLPSRTWWSGDLSSHSLRVPRSNKRFSSRIQRPGGPAPRWRRLLGSTLKMPRLA